MRVLGQLLETIGFIVTIIIPALIAVYITAGMIKKSAGSTFSFDLLIGFVFIWVVAVFITCVTPVLIGGAIWALGAGILSSVPDVDQATKELPSSLDDDVDRSGSATRHSKGDHREM